MDFLSSFNPYTDDFYETGSQVQEWIMRRARTFLEEGAKRRARADRETHRTECRREFLRSLGGLPETNVPLEILSKGSLKREGYSIRKIIYQSLPSVYVAGLIYVPENLSGRAPGVLMACGHSRDGKAAPAYQRVCIDLVRAGFVVLTIDSPGHGEMVQCLNESGEPVAGMNTREHSFLQISSSILGQNIARYFIWNAMRGLDLLCELPEVDPSRIGMTGNSGGGTLTHYLMLLDDRIQAAMPCCCLSSRESYLATGARAYDGEQNLYGCLPGYLDYADFLASFAPKPLCIGAAEYDYFCIEGALETFEEVRKVYGNAEEVEMCIAKGELHGYSGPLRRKCVEFLSKHLHGETRKGSSEDLSVETPETLRCTESGQVQTEFSNAKSILDLNRVTWEHSRMNTEPLSRKGLEEMVRREPRIPLRFRRTSRKDFEHCRVERVFYFTEPAILNTAVVYLPIGKVSAAVVLLIPDGTEGQKAYAEMIRSHLEADTIVMVLDVRGTGAVKMHRRNVGEGLAFRSTEFRVASDHFLLGDSLAQRRAFDVLRGLEYLRLRPEVDAGTKVFVQGQGWPSIYGLIAAAVDGNLSGCLFNDLPESWAEAFELRASVPERVSESLILPELAGKVDLAELRRLAGCR